MVRVFICAALLAFVLAGCGTPSRYHLAQDRGPGKDVDISQLKEPLPKATKPGLRGNKSPYTVWGKSYRVLESGQGYVAEGIASWYGKKFHGYETSNGEIYDMYRFTAAHKSLPIPIYARVTNLTNNRQVIVRVNDRGPFHGNRLIDLSYAAAKKLGFTDRGTARVKIETYPFLSTDPVAPEVAKPAQLTIVSPASKPENIAEDEAGNVIKPQFFLQVGAYSDKSAAMNTVAHLTSLSVPSVVLQQDESRRFYRVRIGPFASQQDAEKTMQTLPGDRYPDSFLVNSLSDS